ncbi:TetR/AcrR family transcriptional regulator [Acidaminobacter hydrogenoformans]|uniref:Transcriptional regulator, TetR family n=1 Tax=Acidaminobacter hydrogenoformans DSM 2784 TaxID=1120920 RepID=A0A1G5S1M0_9FIRM|nr:TetR/AcrR family transcriptional regulator [Acidaminobacter hydrogenoformans]SCZ80027.1 transcriptional regulator, TetR family [Acidaminobacter hydrogenoformans DSM 2784]
MEIQTNKRVPRGARTKKKIFDAAIELIKTKGYQNVTIDEICAACNVTKGAFYYHFSTKESVIEQIHLDTDQIVERKIAQLLKMPPSLKIFQDMSYFYGEITVERGVEVMRHKLHSSLDSDPLSGGYHNFFDPEKRPVLKLFKSIFQEIQKNGEVIQEVTFEYFFRHLIITYNGVVLDWCCSDGSYDLPSEIEMATQRYLKSFQTKYQD